MEPIGLLRGAHCTDADDQLCRFFLFYRMIIYKHQNKNEKNIARRLRSSC
tara:strand:+ start:523 stop:672 length:150 start_codon:yes stop_codon:yes gene_type:complete